MEIALFPCKGAILMIDDIEKGSRILLNLLPKLIIIMKNDNQRILI